MATFVAHGSANLSPHLLGLLNEGEIAAHSPSAFTIQSPRGYTFKFEGTGLSGFSGGLPSHGVITRISETGFGNSGFAISGLNIAASDLRAFVQQEAIGSFEHTVFAGNDVFRLADGNRDVVTGDGGNDAFDFGASLDSRDRVNGGQGNDVVRLDGDYSTHLQLEAHALQGVEKMELLGQHSYNLSIADGDIAAGATLTVDASALDAHQTFRLRDRAETDGHLSIIGGAGNDTIITGSAAETVNTGAGNDTLNLGGGNDHAQTGSGNDHVLGGGGNDVIDLGDGNDWASGNGGNDALNFGKHFNADDRVNGGSGTDTLYLAGDYSRGVTLAAQTMKNIETMHLAGGNSYNFTFADGNIAAGATMTVDGRALGSGNSLHVNDSSENNGKIVVLGGLGDDTVTVGNHGSLANLGGGDDTFHAGAGSDDVNGGAGNDNFYFGFNFNVSDDVNGGAGSDTLHLSTPVAGVLSLTLGSSNMQSVEHVDLGDGDYNLTIGTGGLDVAKLDINALKVDVGHTVTIDGSAALATALTLVGGAGDNILTGGAGDDTLIAGLGSNILNGGGGGADTFVFNAIGGTDSIVNFDGALDTLDVGHAVTGIDTSLLGGLLNDLGGLGTLVGSLLGANHAMEISPLLGALAGQNFLVIDQNGQSGFQAGQDLVVQLENATHLGSLGLGNFGI
ncbi:MAG TPA: calcium-binding protein [Rhizomicrobium sp.]|jgi:Ca2+-binding RTX toxin-like protein|nr:calcium-binding protein [Rhizomicrobium sp.]